MATTSFTVTIKSARPALPAPPGPPAPPASHFAII